MASINRSVVYGEIQKIATNGGDPRQARSRIDLFRKDVATSRLGPDERSEHVSKLREMIVTASQRHPGAAHSVFQEAIDALAEVSLAEETRDKDARC